MGPLIRRAFSGVFPKHSLIALLACMFCTIAPCSAIGIKRQGSEHDPSTYPTHRQIPFYSVYHCGLYLSATPRSDQCLYYPDNKVYGPTPAEAESITFTAKDGTHLHGWFIPTAFGRPENAVATVIHAHGNAGNMSAHWPLVSWLPERNVNLFMFDYRGFGESEGTPSQEGLLDDTKSAIDYVRHRADVNPERPVLLGQSPAVIMLAAVGHCVGCANMRYADRGIRAIISTQRFILFLHRQPDDPGQRLFA